MDFELRELQYFVAVADKLHFGRAAEAVGINQSPLSRAITLMERRLGARLFVRTRRRTRLTTVGEAMLPDARRILAEVENARGNFKSAAAGRQGRLRVAVSEGVGLPRLARLLAQVREDDPLLDVDIEYLPFRHQYYRLCAETLDIGLMQSASDEPAAAERELIALPLWRDRVVLAMRPADPLAKQAVVDSLDPAGVAFIPLGEDYIEADANRRLIWSLYRVQDQDQSPKVHSFVAGVEALLMMVAAGYGVGAMGAAQAEMVKREDVVFRPASVMKSFGTYIVRRRDDQESIAITRFIERARQMAG